jgi:hypothetical protein
MEHEQYISFTWATTRSYLPHTCHKCVLLSVKMIQSFYNLIFDHLTLRSLSASGFTLKPQFTRSLASPITLGTTLALLMLPVSLFSHKMGAFNNIVFSSCSICVCYKKGLHYILSTSTMSTPTIIKSL